MNTLGNWEWKIEDSDNRPLLNLTIKNTDQDKNFIIKDIDWATVREDFLRDAYNSAIEELEGNGSCCHKGKVTLVPNT